MVRVKGVLIDDLPQRDFERNAHQLARSQVDIEMEGNKKEMKFPLLVHSEMIQVIVQHNSISNYTKFQIGKEVQVTREKKLFNQELWP